MSTDPYDAVLQSLGWERTRENYIRVIYDQPPEEWDSDAEAELPEDLRLDPAPSTPFI
jgi:hypothetical protein